MIFDGAFSSARRSTCDDSMALEILVREQALRRAGYTRAALNVIPWNASEARKYVDPRTRWS